MESDSCDEGDSSPEQVKFVDVIIQFPVLLSKSSLPEYRKKKAAAIAEVKGCLLSQFGLQMTENQIWKKLQNMKARIKKKSDKNRTGNKKIRLKVWEEQFLKFIEGDKNPSISRLKGGISAGVRRQSLDEMNIECDNLSDAENTPLLAPVPNKILQIKTREATTIGNSLRSNANSSKDQIGPKMITKLPETEETKALSTVELQRLVLLEQLQVYRLIKENLLKKKEPRQIYEEVLEVDETTGMLFGELE